MANSPQQLPHFRKADVALLVFKKFAKTLFANLLVVEGVQLRSITITIELHHFVSMIFLKMLAKVSTLKPVLNAYLGEPHRPLDALSSSLPESF